MSWADQPKRMKRLKSRKSLDALFQTKPVFSSSLRVHFSLTEEDYFSIAFSAPKRNFKRAVDRNRIKRLMREAVRLEYLALDKCISSNSIWIYSGKQLPELIDLRKSVRAILLRLA